MYPYNDPTNRPVELGASIFTTSTNLNMYRASLQFGLALRDPELGVGPSMGIWDGRDFVMTVCISTMSLEG